MSFNPSFPTDDPTSAPQGEADPFSENLPEQPAPEPAPESAPIEGLPVFVIPFWLDPPVENAIDLPVIVNAGPTPDLKVIHVSVSKHTEWPKSFGHTEKSAGDSINYKVETGYWSVKPKAPIWASVGVDYVRPVWFADIDSLGPHAVEVHLTNELTVGGNYTVEIDSKADAFDRAWKSSTSFIVRGDKVTSLVGGESDGKILPAVLRAFGAVVEETIGTPTTRTLSAIQKNTTEVSVETTAHFPPSGEVFIGGVKFSYTDAGAMEGAKLVGLSSTRYFQPIPENTEVVLHVASILPD